MKSQKYFFRGAKVKKVGKVGNLKTCFYIVEKVDFDSALKILYPDQGVKVKVLFYILS